MGKGLGQTLNRCSLWRALLMTADRTCLVPRPHVAVERLIAVDVPVHAEHAAPARLVVRAAVVVIGAKK